MKKIIGIIFLANLLMFGILALPQTSLAALTSDPVKFTPQVTIPNANTKATPADIFTKDVANPLEYSLAPIARYTKAIYNYGLGIVGILAAIMLMAGGVMWLTAAGSGGQIEKAQSMIISSIVGLVLVFTSYMILRTINPDLVNLKTSSDKFHPIEERGSFCCQTGATGEAVATESECTKKNGQFMRNAMVQDGKCSNPGCCIMKSPTDTTAQDSTSVQCVSSNVAGFSSTFIPDKKCQELIDSGTPGLDTKNTSVLGCEGLEDGDNCEYINSSDGTRSGNNPDTYCYNSVCLEGKGKHGEPCGNHGGSQCRPGGYNGWTDLIEGHCDEKGWHHDRGGRDCGENLGCCYQD
jgi:hypothetical protein